MFPTVGIPRSVRPRSVAALDPKVVYLHGGVLPSTIRLIAHVPEYDGLFGARNADLTSPPSAVTTWQPTMHGISVLKVIGPNLCTLQFA